MDQEIERLVIGIRADTSMFAKDVDQLRGLVDGPLANGLDRAGNALQRSLSKAILTGKLDFEDLRRSALAVINDIAAAAINSGIAAILGGGSTSGSGGLLTLGNAALGAVLGAPGRATGGPVSGGRAYVVGERGPEIFVPTSSGRIETQGGPAQQNIRLTINVSDNNRNSAPDSLRQSSRQIARAVRSALANGNS
ncbi:MAG: tail tape measure protein [Parasphingorhabdus sp.]|nr:tail tape measure protein [Parasphingorhabdus sp.]